MPAIATQPANSHRASFYGRGRTSSSGSSQSSSSNSNQTKISNSNNHSSTFTANVLSKSSSASPHSKQHAAMLVAANVAQKRLQAKPSSSSSTPASSTIQINLEGLQEEAKGRKNDLDEEEYQAEIIQHMQHMETETSACVDLMDAQPELRWFMRPYLVDFIVEIHQTFRLRPETLYLTMNIVDRYVSKRIVYKRHYQLVGCAALLIASKFEDSKDKVPTVSELRQMCCNAYDRSAFLQMEGHVLSTIAWVLGFPTPEAWLRIQAVQGDIDAKTQSVARFLMEASLFHRDFIAISPSHLAAGSLLLARYICNQAASQEESKEAIQAAQVIDTFMINNLTDLSEILIKKYSFAYLSSASGLVKDWYAKSAELNATQKMTSVATGLLPAQSVSVQHLAQHDKASEGSSNNTTAIPSPSSFSTPQHRREDEDEEMNTRSRCTSPSSMISTPSRMSGNEADDDDDIEEEEDADMPVTPLSLNSLHDPLIATSSSSDRAQKENGKMQAPKNLQSNSLQVKVVRPVLTISNKDNKMTTIGS
ncbi:hypothetical protein CBS101457_004549 [Exobasidium rhododendri]|nr:hypothetical protein CBS101457_004549 [Exobasidium rhododendri]